MSKQGLKRRPLFRRTPGFRREKSRAGRFELTARDLDLITSIGKHRFMNTAQIVRLWGCTCELVEKDGVRDGQPVKIQVKSHRDHCGCSCRLRRGANHEPGCVSLFKDNVHLATRLRELFQHGFLDRPVAQLYLRLSPKIGTVREGSAPMVYCVTTQGIEAIGADRRASLGYEKLSWVGKPNEGDRFYMQHTLAIGNTSVGVDCAVRKTGSLVRLSEADLCAGMSEKRKTSGKRWQLPVKHQGVEISTVCDLAFGIGDLDRARRYNFLCEIDMGTMTVWHDDLSKSSILRKLVGYARAEFDGLFAKELGWKGVRVVFLTTSNVRVQSMIDAAKKKFRDAAEGRLFLFGTLNAVDNLLDYNFRDINGKQTKLIREPVASSARLFD